MTEERWPFFYLAGAGGGGEHDLAAFASGLEEHFRFEGVPYPGWQRYVAKDFSVEALIAELAARIAERAPVGPVGVMGLSIGGHFGYAVALRLQALGREVVGFCAIDSFLFENAQPSSGWQGRALSRGVELLRERRFGELAQFVRSRAWRALLRLAGGRLMGPLRQMAGTGVSPGVLAMDAVAEQELSMRLLIRAVAPWLARLDDGVAPLDVPAVLLRTASGAGDDAAWRRRCPGITICEVPGRHFTLFTPEHLGALQEGFRAAFEGLRASPETVAAQGSSRA